MNEKDRFSMIETWREIIADFIYRRHFQSQTNNLQAYINTPWTLVDLKSVILQNVLLIALWQSWRQGV